MTDVYLLALAKRHHGTLAKGVASFDDPANASAIQTFAGGRRLTITNPARDELLADMASSFWTLCCRNCVL